MNLRLEEIIPDSNNPFGKCVLKREEYALALTTIVSNKEGFVLSINNSWGGGKTTFVKMWQKLLEKNEYKTLFFNAWENDLSSDPMVAILGELKKLATRVDETKFNKVLKTGALLARNIIPGIGKAVVSKYVDCNVLETVIEGAINSSVEYFEKEVDEYTKRQTQVAEFKKEIQEFLLQGESDKPVIFFVDELDRCRPDYAVEVLEKIKHFFSVKGIVFVLSIDKKQLGNAIRGYYGSDLIDADEYLRRFIDVEYRLPDPNVDAFCKHLFERYKLGEFYNPDRKNEFSEEKDSFLNFSTNLISSERLHLRQIERLYTHCFLSLKRVKEKQRSYPELLFFLLYLRMIRYDVYEKIQNMSFDIQDLVDAVEPILLNKNNSNDNIRQSVLVRVIHSYCLYVWKNRRIVYKPIKEEDGKSMLTFKSQLSINDFREYEPETPDVINEFTLLNIFNSIEIFSHIE